MYLKELCVSEITNILLSWKQFEYMLSEHLSVAKNIIVRIVNCCLLEKYLKIIKIVEVSEKRLDIGSLCYLLIFTIGFAILKYNDSVMDYVITVTGINTVLLLHCHHYYYCSCPVT